MPPGPRELFFDASPVPSLLLDTAATVVATNVAARTLFEGLGRPRVVMVPFGELLSPRSQALWLVALAEMGADGSLEPTLVELADTQPGRGRVLCAARATPDEDGERAAILVTLVDVAGRLQVAEDSLITANRYRSIMQTARDAILTLDVGWNVSLANPAAGDMFGAPGNGLLGRGALDLVAPEHRDAFGAALDEGSRGTDGSPRRLSLECVRVSDAVRFPVDVSISTFRTELGLQHTVVIRDESEREGLRRALERKAVELGRKNEELEAFSYSVSHALKAPLRTMGSFASLLHGRYRDRLDETGARYLSFLVDTCDEQAQQIEQLLDLSKLSRSEDAFEPVAVEPIVRKILDFYVLNQPKRQIDVSLEGEPPVIVAQRIAVYHLFDNLIGNAVKFSATRPVTHLTIGFSEDAAEHHIRVSDNGIGIDPNHQDTIFRLFGRLHRREEYEGTGAGLNIVLKILERHGGRIELESEPDVGTTFHVFLPRRSADDPLPNSR